MKKIKGFTLIELMIITVIVGVLAALAIPAYQDYLIKYQVSEGLVLASGSKTSVSEYWSNKGQLPIDNESIDYTSQHGKYVKETSIDTGSIIAVFGNESNEKIANNYVKLVPDVSGNNLTWDCNSNLPTKYLPLTCSTSTEIIPDNGGGSGIGNSNGSGNSGSGNNSNGGSVTPPVTPPSTEGKTLSSEQKSKYPEVDQAYNRYFDSASKVSQFQQSASNLQQQADSARQSGDMNRYNQLIGQANNDLQQANNYKTQMDQAQTQYNQAINVYKGRNNGSLPSDFPIAPK